MAMVRQDGGGDQGRSSNFKYQRSHIKSVSPTVVEPANRSKEYTAVPSKQYLLDAKIKNHVYNRGHTNSKSNFILAQQSKELMINSSKYETLR